MKWLLLSIFLALLQTIGGDGSVSEAVKAFASEYPVGDARWCIDQARRTKFDLKRFEVLPGMGWDNLRNVEAGMVVTYNYTECKVTDDGRYLIPDSVFTIPIKASKVNSFAEVIDSWLNSSSTTSHTVNVQGGFNNKKVVASGSFSFEHSNLKTKQVEDNSVTVRVQLRYNRYEAKLQPDPNLTPAFKRRLLEMGADIELNNTDKARYSGQLLVRDFGTHYLTSLTAGAALGKDDYIKRSYLASSDESKTDILAKASASFFSVFDLKTSYGYKNKDTTAKSYNDHLTRSYIWSHGGPLIGANGTANEWIKGLDLNLVAVDRVGEPLYNLVTESMLPELPPQTVAELTTVVRQSIELYYAWNTIRGCTKLGSPNFSFSANFDDGSCNKKSTNMTFGGVFQTCSVNGRYQRHSPCQGKDQVNPLTGKTSCPPSYKAVKLATEQTRIYQEHCVDHFFWETCHRWVSIGTYTSFWCAASGSITQNSGYLFGGLYTKKYENPVTRGFTCPPSYYAFPLLTDLKVCISDDFELSAGQSLPFGGFFSCDSGNPLSHGLIKPVSLKAVKNENGGVSLGSYFRNVDNTENFKTQMTKKCPEGYSQHIATLTQGGCAVHYCVRSGYLSGPLTPPVKRPPFTDPPTVRPSDNLFIYDPKAQTWQKNKKVEQVKSLKSKSYAGDSQDDGLSAGTAAGISVVATLSCVAIATIVVVAVQKRRKRKRTQYRPLVGESLENPVSYGSSNTADTVIPQVVVSEQA